MQNTLVEEILKRPDAALQLEYFKSAMLDEQERRQTFREWLTPEVKAEFINGEVIIHSPVRRAHWGANDLLSRLLSFFVSIRKLGRIGTEKVMISLTRNDYEPDLVFFGKEKVAQFTEDQVLFPAPDFVVEILSRSTVGRDRGTKKEDYALHSVPEYWIVNTDEQRVEQYILAGEAKSYFPAKIHQYGDMIKSHAIEGFNIPVAALFDKETNVKTMQTFMKS